MTAHAACLDLSLDHPGFHDPGEHEVWRRIWRELEPRHARWVAPAIQRVLSSYPLDRGAIPQLADVSEALASRTGFRMIPVTGLVPPRRFLGCLAEGLFLSTQYVRHASRPLYTPEPDIVHELVGHAATLADPRLAAINRQFGAVARLADEAGLRRLERVYWYTLEFGVCHDAQALRAVGAGLLSSAGELDRLEAVPLRPWNLQVIAGTDYDTTDYQPSLFVAPS